jgi:methylated-DNA-[protein]-cysteine S-methyltransferase
MNELRQRELATPIGTLTLVASRTGLTNILFATESPGDANLPADLPTDESDPTLALAVLQLEEYFAGERTEFDLPLDLRGTEFQQEAWLALADVPYGATASYGAQAEAIGRPGAARAVGAANGQNPIPIVLPCHRIVGADGSLTGFGGGLDVKQRLLDLEHDQQSLPGV